MKSIQIKTRQILFQKTLTNSNGPTRKCCGWGNHYALMHVYLFWCWFSKIFEVKLEQYWCEANIFSTSHKSIHGAFTLDQHSLDFICVFTSRKRSLGQGNIFRNVCQEFCWWGGVCLSACWDTPLGAGTPWAGSPLEQAPPHRSRACWEIRSTSGRYASYWNAFLFKIIFLAKSHVGTPGRSVPHPRRILDQINKISTQSKTAKIQDCTDSPGSIRYSAWMKDKGIIAAPA